ncbi:MAG TPA: acyl-ACP--UDP-N-acetylglucosamine O-acyltransferase [Gammaproteobacteria bacterium]|nr:acyl-ACP--UDP-N-acetylglucosamine O-acyltransferase [Gammaproteobacteria bacterium]
MIDSRALIHPGAQIAEGVRVGAFAILGENVRIGAGTTIGAHTIIEGPSEIGEGNRIFPFVSLGLEPQDKKYGGEETALKIGNGNTIREFCTINRGTAQHRNVTEIGDDNWIMAYVHIAHDCVIGDHTILANNVTLGGHVSIGDWAVLGGFAKVHQFCRLGSHCFAQMDAGIAKDVPPYVMAAGMPARPRGVNREGLRRRGFTPAAIRAIVEAYRLIYRSGHLLADARGELALRAGTQPALVPLVEFLAASERSIIR